MARIDAYLRDRVVAIDAYLSRAVDIDAQVDDLTVRRSLKLRHGIILDSGVWTALLYQYAAGVPVRMVLDCMTSPAYKQAYLQAAERMELGSSAVARKEGLVRGEDGIVLSAEALRGLLEAQSKLDAVMELGADDAANEVTLSQQVLHNAGVLCSSLLARAEKSVSVEALLELGGSLSGVLDKLVSGEAARMVVQASFAAALTRYRMLADLEDTTLAASGDMTLSDLSWITLE